MTILSFLNEFPDESPHDYFLDFLLQLKMMLLNLLKGEIMKHAEVHPYELYLSSYFFPDGYLIQ